ncbi:MAG: molecular chaperone HtpG [Ruminococcaceae bacterium]|nr:molecular chaperone HtpG [Oscillospiraceae bacterium]
MERGGISVEAAHIFPIIKKWLYSDKEIFLREIVSNSCDAVTKLRRLISLGEVKDIEDKDFKVTVTLDKEAGTITVCDNGIGMTVDELKRYICQIALSGALEFIEKYEGENGDAAGIIGHFGLGFYSSFMVSSTVEVITKSYTGAPAVKWVCADAGEYEIEENCDTDELFDDKGTAVIMHVSDEGKEFLEASALRDILDKYCAFMPVEIYFDDGEEKSCDCEEENCEHKPTPINDTCPLWLKNPSDCEAEDYKKFYTKVFHDFREPLFHIHIKADYPLNFKGILYFPKITNEFESLEGQVKLYYNQVFVSDNIKEVIPEYLLMLRGVLDCPELPLNVSRSYLQNSGYVTKISAHIVKKVADKLNSMFNLDREGFEKIWNDVKTFVEYGCMRDRKFYDRVKNSIVYRLCDGSYATLAEYLESAKDKHENKIYYTSDKTKQASYISMLEAQGIKVAVLDKFIDTQFINTVEMNEAGVKFCRVDSELADAVKGGDASEIEAVSEVFKKIIPEETKITFESFKDEGVPAILNISEQSRRMEDMMKMYSAMGEEAPMSFPTEATLIINSNNALIKKLEGSTDEAMKEIIAKHIYNLCLISQRGLSAEELKSFLSDSFEILSML